MPISKNDIAQIRSKQLPKENVVEGIIEAVKKSEQTNNQELVAMAIQAASSNKAMAEIDESLRMIGKAIEENTKTDELGKVAEAISSLKHDKETFLKIVEVIKQIKATPNPDVPRILEGIEKEAGTTKKAVQILVASYDTAIRSVVDNMLKSNESIQKSLESIRKQIAEERKSDKSEELMHKISDKLTNDANAVWNFDIKRDLNSRIEKVIVKRIK